MHPVNNFLLSKTPQNNGTLIGWVSSREKRDRLEELYSLIYTGRASLKEVIEYETLLYENRINRREEENIKIEDIITRTSISSADIPSTPPGKRIRTSFENLNVPENIILFDYFRARSHHETFRFGNKYLYIRHEMGLCIIPVSEISSITTEKIKDKILIFNFYGSRENSVKCFFAFAHRQKNIMNLSQYHINGSDPFLYEKNLKENIENILSSAKNQTVYLENDNAVTNEQLVQKIENGASKQIIVNLWQKLSQRLQKSYNKFLILTFFTPIIFFLAPSVIIFLQHILNGTPQPFSLNFNENTQSSGGCIGGCLLPVFFLIILSLIIAKKSSINKQLANSEALRSSSRIIAEAIHHYSLIYKISEEKIADKFENSVSLKETYNTDIRMAEDLLFILSTASFTVLNLAEIKGFKRQIDMISSRSHITPYRKGYADFTSLIAENKNGIEESFNIFNRETGLRNLSFLKEVRHSFPHIVFH